MTANQSISEVEAAQEALRSAILKGDAASLERVMHPDLTYSHSNAHSETRAEAIAAIVAPGGTPKSVEFHDGKTTVYGDTAIYKGKVDITTSAGALIPLDALMVWLKTPQGWQLLARQVTRIPQA